eukprot:scaffold6271_cov171-Amphora_coffeaeformis.AAC.4
MESLTSKQKERLELLTNSEPQVSEKKKKRKKNKASTAQGVEDDGSVSATHEMALATVSGRPGKKKLRKLRYQQQRLSSTEFLLASAEYCKFTGSVATDPPSMVVENTVAAADIPAGSKIQVVASCFDNDATDLVPSPCGAIFLKRVHIKPLLVLDVNGILCHRIRFHKCPHIPKTAYREAIAHIASTPVIPRTDLVEFLSFLDRHFCLAIWTSAKNKNATALVKALIPPDIAQRFLFVWAQHHCDKVCHKDDGEEDCVFEKNLTKVWKEYPLWNAHTTILMDDTVEKCQRSGSNSVHPPALNGMKFEQLSDDRMPDETNEKIQRDFLKGLVRRLRKEPVITEWTVKTPVVEEVASMDSKGDEQDPFHLMGASVLLDYLRENSLGHMIGSA